MPVVERENMDGTSEKDHNSDKTDGATNDDLQQHTEAGPGGAKTRRFLTKKTASNRLKAQATFITSIRAMELDTDPGNYGVHEVLTGQLLDNLEREHNEYVGKEGLDINVESEKSYINEYKEKLNRATRQDSTISLIKGHDKEAHHSSHG